MKTGDSAQTALQQINNRGYAIPYQTDGRRVVKVGVKFDMESRTPQDWVVEE